MDGGVHRLDEHQRILRVIRTSASLLVLTTTGEEGTRADDGDEAREPLLGTFGVARAEVVRRPHVVELRLAGLSQDSSNRNLSVSCRSFHPSALSR